jgi:hypothetical protein
MSCLCGRPECRIRTNNMHSSWQFFSQRSNKGPPVLPLVGACLLEGHNHTYVRHTLQVEGTYMEGEMHRPFPGENSQGRTVVVACDHLVPDQVLCHAQRTLVGMLSLAFALLEPEYTGVEGIPGRHRDRLGEHRVRHRWR